MAEFEVSVWDDLHWKSSIENCWSYPNMTNRIGCNRTLIIPTNNQFFHVISKLVWRLISIAKMKQKINPNHLNGQSDKTNPKIRHNKKNNNCGGFLYSNIMHIILFMITFVLIVFLFGTQIKLYEGSAYMVWRKIRLYYK